MFKLEVQWDHYNYVLQYHAVRLSPTNVRIYSKAFLIVVALRAVHVHFERILHAGPHKQQLRIAH